MVSGIFTGYTRRIWLLIGGMAAMLGVLGMRLYVLQVLQGREHAEAIRRQSVRTVRLAPVRGRIFTRDGVPLTENQPRYDVLFHLHEMRRPGRRAMSLTNDYVLKQSAAVGSVIGRPSELSEREVKDHRYFYGGILPLEVFSDLNPRELARIEELMPAIPGLEISTGFDRVYPRGDLAPHLLGFVAMANPEPEADEVYDFVRREWRGRSGLEARFDDELRGHGGSRQVLIDTAGYTHELISEQAPVNGNDLILNIDSRAQAIAVSLLQGKMGAMVLMDVENGAVLALASAPTYDLGQMSGRYYSTLLQDPEAPLRNRALVGNYMPGSIAKPLVAAAILESGLTGPDDRINCDGAYVLEGRSGHSLRIRCWNHYGHGEVNVVDALQTSCNPFLITAGMQVGIDRLQPMFASAGLGRPTGLELSVPGDSGILPSRDDMQRRNGRAWVAADTAFICIGQGHIAISPMQAAVYTAAIANGGHLLRPQLVGALRDPKGRYVPGSVTARDITGALAVSPENLALIREGMYRAVNGDRPTAKAARNTRISLAGKTGTAEVGSRANRTKNTWFICFGPVEKPRYALVVFVEGGESGGRTCAPLASAFFERWLAPAEDGRVSALTP